MAIKTVTGATSRPYVHVQIVLSQACTITATGVDAPAVTNATGDVTGAYSTTLWATNDLTPTGTYYTVTEYLGSTDTTFAIQVPQTAGPFTVSSILVTPPTTVSAGPNHLSTLTVDDLTNPGVVYADTAGLVATDSTFTFNKATKLLSATAATLTGALTAASSAITNAVTAASAAITGLMHSGTLTVDGGAGSPTITSGDIAARSLTVASGSGPYTPYGPAGSINNVIYVNATYDGVTDDWQAFTDAIALALAAGGGDVWATGRGPGKMTALVTKTIHITSSRVRLHLATGVTINFVPSDPVTNNVAIFVHGGASALRSVTGAIAIGATSFVSTNGGADVSDLVAGDWVILSESDTGAGDIVLIDWVQVRTVVGSTVNTQAPIRTAFPATGGGRILSFRRITTLVEGVQLHGIEVNIPAAANTIVAFYVSRARRTLLFNCTSNNAKGNGFDSYEANDLTLSNCQQLADGTQASEFAATVGLVISSSHLGMYGSATTGQIQPNTSAMVLDFGTCFFSITGNHVGPTGNIAIVLVAVHDGIVSGNAIDWVRDAGLTVGQGISGLGCKRVIVANNVLVGGDDTGPGNKGISFADTTTYSVNITNAGNILGPNVINNFVYPSSGGQGLTFGAASALIPGATSFSIRDVSDTNNNLLVSNAGVVTVRAGLTVSAGNIDGSAGNSNLTLGSGTITSGAINSQTLNATASLTGTLTVATGFTLTAGNAAVTAGNLTFGAASAKIIPGATSLLFRNNADSASNLILADAGAVTFRGPIATSTAAVPSVLVTDLSANGPTFRLVSNGTNPNKTIRVNSATGDLEVVNSAYNTPIFSITDTGIVGFPAAVALGGGAAPTVGTIGGSGPATAAQHGWLKINMAGVAAYVPEWR